MGFKTDINNYLNGIASYDLIIFEGQSNCSGAALISDFDSYLTGELSGCYILNQTSKDVQLLNAGINNQRDTSTQKAGFELKLMYDLQLSMGKDVYMCKTDKSGTQLYQDAGLTDWNDLSEGEYFDEGVTNTNLMIDHIIGIDRVPKITITWIQGENDAVVTKSSVYQTNLFRYMKSKIDAIHSHFKNNYSSITIPHINVIITRLSSVANSYGDAVRTAQLNVVASNPYYTLYNTSHLTFQDGVHYDAPSYILGGGELATLIQSL